jgi:hypothetical protein
MVAKVLRSLWAYRDQLNISNPDEDKVETKLFELLARIEGSYEIARTDAIERFEVSETLEELVASIERDISANRPEAALDRLHTYCSKKFGHLLETRGITWDRNEPLHARVGKYVKVVSDEQQLKDMSLQIIKNSIGVFDKFNHIRKNQTLAHDNQLLEKAEARFIFDSVSAILRFVKSLDAARFEI